MSGSLIPVWTERNVGHSSKSIASILGCFSDNPKEIVQCLRERNTDDILKAFKTQYQVSIILNSSFYISTYIKEPRIT